MAYDKFTIGSNKTDTHYYSNSPEHAVELSSFLISKTPVTIKVWNAVMDEKYDKPFTDTPEESPVIVSWSDTQEFMEKLLSLTGKKYRLPTEAEWEYAAGGGADFRFMYGGTNDRSEIFDYVLPLESNRNYYQVGKQKPNKAGLYDILSSPEWCQDWIANYNTMNSYNPTGAVSGSHKVIRGKVFLSREDKQIDIIEENIYARSYGEPNRSFATFRIVSDL